MIHIYTYTPPIKDFKKFLFWTSFQNFFRSSICKNTQFNAIESFFLPPPPLLPQDTLYLHKLLSNPNINILLRWFFFPWIRKQSRLCTMESRSWKEKSSGWSRHFLRYFRARNRPFIPSFPPFSTEQRAKYRAYLPPGGWICIVAVVVDRLFPQWIICRPDERRNQRDSGMETLVSTSFQRLIRKTDDACFEWYSSIFFFILKKIY